MPPPREQARMSPPRWWAFVLAGLCYSLFTAAAFPPAGVWVLAVFAPVPLVWAGCRAVENVKRSALLTALGVLPLWVYEQAWLFDVTRLGYPILAIYMSVYAALFVWLFAVTRRCWALKARGGPMLPACVVAPIVWVSLEVLRGEVVLTGYPWYLAGHPLIEAPLLAAPAAIFGAYFVSFLTVSLSGALADAAGWMGMSRGIGGIAAAATGVAWLFTGLLGRAPDPTTSTPTVRVAVIQTNVPQDNKLGWEIEQRVKDWELFVRMTKDAATRSRPDLIVWPETMFPGEAINAEFIEDSLRLLRERNLDPARVGATMFIPPLAHLQEELGVPLLIGAEAVEGLHVEKGKDGQERFAYGKRYNSVYLLEKGTIRDERYDKMELTPFGETVPYVWRWPSVREVVERAGAGGMKFDLSTGKSPHVFNLELAANTAARPEGKPATGPAELNFVTPICFEVTKSVLCRRLVYKDGTRQAGLIINVSNDGWFGPTDGWRVIISGGRSQHLQATRWRCVELGVPMVRAVNTGISAFIDARGKIRQAEVDSRDSAMNAAGILVANVPIPDGTGGTVFGRIGNLFGWLVVGLSVVLPFGGILAARRRSNQGSNSGSPRA